MYAVFVVKIIRFYIRIYSSSGLVIVYINNVLHDVTIFAFHFLLYKIFCFIAVVSVQILLNVN